MKTLHTIPKIYISTGHTCTSFGAVNHYWKLREHNECIKTLAEIIRIDQNIKHSKKFHIVTVPSDTLEQKITYINKRISEKDIAIELHYNSSKKINTAHGFEILYYPNSIHGKLIALNINRKFSKYLPFKNRGIKKRSDLIFLSKTKVPAILIEPLFLNHDIETAFLLMSHGHKIIGKAIYLGIVDYFTKLQ